jgi:uncharacterized membrane protein YbhN (UPF0104 family)
MHVPSISARTLTSDIVACAPAFGDAPGRRRRLAWLPAIIAAALFGVLISLHAHEFVDAAGRALHASWKLVVLCAMFEVASLAGYVFLLHRVVASASPELRLKDSYDITLAGTAAMRLVPTAGLGGAAVTVWALHARGVRPREVAERLLAFLLLLYLVYMAALLLSGAAVAVGLVHVGSGSAVGLLGALLAAAVGGGLLSLFATPSLSRRLLGLATQGSPRLAAAARRANEQLPVLRAALQRAWLELRRGHPALLGALAWWGFDIAVLATMLHAFGSTMPFTAVVLAYLLGTMFNVLPLPGSLSGGLIGVLAALGAHPGEAIAAVLAYRAVSVWLPATSGIASLASLRTSVRRWRAETAFA